jgi:hypothetical protein
VRTIPLASQKQLLRLISARTDMKFAADAYKYFSSTGDENARYHFLLSMVVAYCRPFTENQGIGSLMVVYPSFPDFPDPELNERHKRMMDLRNKMLSHSSIEGTKVHILAPGAESPRDGKIASGYHYVAAKLIFSLDPRFVDWLHELIVALSARLNADIDTLVKSIGSQYLKDGEIFTLDTGNKEFEWSK